MFENDLPFDSPGIREESGELVAGDAGWERTKAGFLGLKIEKKAAEHTELRQSKFRPEFIKLGTDQCSGNDPAANMPRC